MTTNPEPEKPPATPSPTETAQGPVISEVPERTASAADSTLDVGTFSTIPEPRRPGLVIGDGTWHQLARPYLVVQLISTALWLVLVAVAATVLSLATGVVWVWIPASVLLVVFAVTLAITPRQVRSFGYRLRENDLVLRRGILFQRVVAVPYGRMQLVDITHGPLDRAFGIAQLKLVTAAAATAVALPGLTQAAAEELRDALIEVAETRRTGL
ncbi:PH domain-containing protein [Microbacterium caowuchunii]|uniref:PH domain-containing protein n=1 Tax=Microbacterium caowuchunii TaxID=2614638 RepID=UPI0012476299|nr:PH domain-containing protein [Microbacterium caowuchunii]QEV98873.1 PH domain-containing protein [Microbacterium caowuchunii]